MKVGVVGSRSFVDHEILRQWLDYVQRGMGIDVVISGGAKGADAGAKHWASDNGIPIRVHTPDWRGFGRRAGMLRNTKIVAEADMIVAFWDGRSIRTKDSIDKALAMKKPTFIVYI